MHSTVLTCLGHLRRAVAAVAGLAVVAASAAPGDFDTTFGLGFGKVIAPVGAGGLAYSAALQPDGKIVAVGGCPPTVGALYTVFCVARFESSGAPDTSFGVNGRVATLETATGGNAFSSGVAVLPDGRIVAAGTCADTAPAGLPVFCFVRYSASGVLDTTFANGGVARIAVPDRGVYTTRGLLLQPDGKFVAAAYCTLPSNGNGSICLTRVLANGTLDTTFGDGGTKVLSVLGNDRVTAISAQPDGKILAAGFCRDFTPTSATYACVVRVLSTGQLDNTFGTNNGMVIMLAAGINNNNAEYNAVAVQHDGKILIGGVCRASGNTPQQFCLIRLLPNGTADATIGSLGLVITMTATSYAEVQNISLQPDGKIVLTGNCITTANPTKLDFCSARLHDTGVLDVGYSGDGRSVTPVGTASDFVYTSLLQADGKLILAGNCNVSPSSGFCFARLEGGPYTYQNCRPDIDGDGTTTATTDGLILTRVMLGMTGPSVLSGITIPTHASRKTWYDDTSGPTPVPGIRTYLTAQCGMSIRP